MISLTDIAVGIVLINTLIRRGLRHLGQFGIPRELSHVGRWRLRSRIALRLQTLCHIPAISVVRIDYVGSVSSRYDVRINDGTFGTGTSGLFQSKVVRAR